jgi:DNA-directed RNA polymerase subunit RPC12/RpoP
MAEYIKREAVLKRLRELDCLCASFIAKMPYVEAEPTVHGRWEQVHRWATKAKYRCSVCGREIMSATKVNIEKYPYCHCGARMDGE